MSDADHRDTFLSYRELLEHSADRCARAAQALRARLAGAGERETLTMQAVADAEQELSDVLNDYATSGPEDLLKTRLQYQLQEEEPPAPRSLEEAFERLLEVNAQIAEIFHDQAVKNAVVDFGDILENVRERVDATGRRISEIEQTAQDV